MAHTAHWNLNYINCNSKIPPFRPTSELVLKSLLDNLKCCLEYKDAECRQKKGMKAEVI